MAACMQKILVIDDERGPRESLRILLKNDYEVLCAESVDRGVELLRDCEPDAVVMDIKMPGKSGIQGLREIRGIDRNVAVIMLTGFGTLETAQEAIRLGANDYLKKPFDAKEMEEVIGRNVRKTEIERRRRIAEQHLTELNQRLTDELKQKQRLAALGEQSSELVHDLRNPLTAVVGYVELLSNQLRDSQDELGDKWGDTSEYLEMIEKSVMRCRELAEMWLSLGKQESARLNALSMCRIIEEVVESQEQFAASRDVLVTFEAKCNGDVMGDHVQIWRALQNIVVNAIDAAPSKNGRISISCVADASEVEIVVSDNGCGMKPEEIEHVFEPYFTRKEHGTGLGLFITKKVIEEHGGKIILESEPGVGTTFRIRLPRLIQA